jgi:hypothetical protein
MVTVDFPRPLFFVTLVTMVNFAHQATADVDVWLGDDGQL